MECMNGRDLITRTGQDLDSTVPQELMKTRPLHIFFKAWQQKFNKHIRFSFQQLHDRRRFNKKHIFTKWRQSRFEN